MVKLVIERIEHILCTKSKDTKTVSFSDHVMLYMVTYEISIPLSSFLLTTYSETANASLSPVALGRVRQTLACMKAPGHGLVAEKGAL